MTPHGNFNSAVINIATLEDLQSKVDKGIAVNGIYMLDNGATYAVANGNSIIAIGGGSGVSSVVNLAICGDSLVAPTTPSRDMFRISLGVNGHYFKYAGNVGVGGNTVAQIENQIPTALALNPNTVAINGGTNDVDTAGFTSNFTSIRATIKRHFSTIQAAGARAIAISLPPSNTAAKVPYEQKLNLWKKLYCWKNNIQFIDIYTPAAQSDGSYRSGYNIDVTHYGALAAYAFEPLATSMLQTNKLLEKHPLLAMSDTQSQLLVNTVNAVNFTDTNADGVPDNWFSTGTGGTYSIQAADAGDLGRWARTTMTAGTNVGITTQAQTLAALGWEIGDKIAIGARIRWNGSLTVTCTTGGSATYTAPDGSTFVNHYFNLEGSGTTGEANVYLEFVLTGGTTFNTIFRGTGTGYFEINRPIAVNLTKLADDL